MGSGLMFGGAGRFPPPPLLPGETPRPPPKPDKWDRALVVIPVVGGLGLIGALMFGVYVYGYAGGSLAQWSKEVRNCLRYENRQFVSGGIFGSGEVYWQNVCVKWEVTR
jgi:hypothetical protein